MASWRHALLEALGPNGRLMADLIPDLKLIIGDQPPAPELPSQQAQSRFQLVSSALSAYLPSPNIRWALYLDDLQWLDTATLDLPFDHRGPRRAIVGERQPASGCHVSVHSACGKGLFAAGTPTNYTTCDGAGLVSTMPGHRQPVLPHWPKRGNRQLASV